MSVVFRYVFGWFNRYVACIVLSNSFAHITSKPAFSKPRSSPPQPENNETTFIVFNQPKAHDDEEGFLVFDEQDGMQGLQVQHYLSSCIHS